MNYLRIPHGVSAKVAKALNVSQNTVSSWLTGKHLPKRIDPVLVNNAFREAVGDDNFPDLFPVNEKKAS